METSGPSRRPLKSRNTRWAAIIARGLAEAGLRPNQISLLSVVFAAAAGAAFVFSVDAGKAARIILLLSAAAGIQLRLLCNLFDGMVAIEGGFRTKAGEIYNEFPDRFADAFILVGAGYASRWVEWSGVLGWAAALLAVMTAYNRMLGVAVGAAQQFCGPMAKPHRMAVMTAAAVLAMGETGFDLPARVIPLALVTVIFGCIVTIIRRTGRIVRELNSR